MNTKEEILHHTTRILAREGYEGTSMRRVASAVGIGPSVIYNHFADKEDLLRNTRQYIVRLLDTGLAKAVSDCRDAHEMLYHTVFFQLRYREKIVALLQYFMAVRTDFPRTDSGYVPERAYRHLRAVIDRGEKEGLFSSPDKQFDARTTTHLINGFIIEYHDRRIARADLETLAAKLTDFIERSLTDTPKHRERYAHITG